MKNFIDIEAIIKTIGGYLPQVIAALLIFLVFRFVYKITRAPLVAVCKKIHLEKPIIKLLVESIYKWLLYILGGLMAAGQLGIDVGAALAGLGVVGIAIGFAAQESLSNIISGFIIFLDKPFKVGDWVRVEEHFGKIHEITMRSTRLQTLNNTYVIIPNSTIINAVLDNHSIYGSTRIEVDIGIAYKESIDDARTAILEGVDTLDDVLKTPEPTVVVQELGDSSVNLVVRVWVDNAEKEKHVFYEVVETSKKALDKADIEIPFPHLQLFMDDITDTAVKKLQEVSKV